MMLGTAYTTSRTDVAAAAAAAAAAASYSQISAKTLRSERVLQKGNDDTP